MGSGSGGGAKYVYMDRRAWETTEVAAEVAEVMRASGDHQVRDGGTAAAVGTVVEEAEEEVDEDADASG